MALKIPSVPFMFRNFFQIFFSTPKNTKITISTPNVMVVFLQVVFWFSSLDKQQNVRLATAEQYQFGKTHYQSVSSVQKWRSFKTCWAGWWTLTAHLSLISSFDIRCLETGVCNQLRKITEWKCLVIDQKRKKWLLTVTIRQ